VRGGGVLAVAGSAHALVLAAQKIGPEELNPGLRSSTPILCGP